MTVSQREDRDRVLDLDPESGGVEAADATAGASPRSRGGDEVAATNRWHGVAALALLIGGAGAWFASPVVLLLAVVPAAYAAHARRGRPPDVALSAEREFSEQAPAPGDPVQITVEVENTGEVPLWDLRLVDGVPAGLTVTDGSPRIGTALRPGRRARFSYEVTARRGVHAFEPLAVVARNLSGTHERRTSVGAAGELVALPDLEGPSDVPLRAASSRFTGRIPTGTGGEGIEFFATREYRPGDSPARVDWNRYAATRELATLEFRRERAATVVLLVDAREQAYRAPEPGADSAVDRSVAGAGKVFAALSDAGDRVAIAGFGPDSCWLPPGAGSDHRERARRLLAANEAFSPEPPGSEYYPRRQLETLRRRAPVDAQFVVFSPVTDDYIATVARRLQASGHPVTVVSPDPTATDDLVRRLAVVERRLRLNRLREAEVRVVDWQPEEPLAVAFDRANGRWG